jgi:alkylhydroperoxidase family enzyme
MAWIKTFTPAEAEGKLKKHYDAAIKRAGRVFGIVRMMSPNVDALGDSMRFYNTLMKGDSPLTRAQREMIAVVTSKANNCFY